MEKFKTLDSYFKSIPEKQIVYLKTIRKTIKQIAPEAVESISYNMPAFKLNGKILAWYAAFKNHYSLFVYPEILNLFKDELKTFKYSKGTLQLSYNSPFPESLIKQIIQHRKNTIEGKKPALKTN